MAIFNPSTFKIIAQALYEIGGTDAIMSYQDFPWFKDAPIGKVLNVEQLTPGHFYWPDLDVDLTSEIIEHPEKFPLKSK